MPEIRWIEASFLAERQVAPWADMPVWVPPSPESAGFATTSTTRARAAGLTIRPLETTVEDTLRWHLARPIAEQSALKAGISAEREQEVLSAWNARR
jgi:2'-hydroxyisoflavone reductase